MPGRLFILCATALLTGCASTAPTQTAAPPEPAYDDAVAASLVYDPPAVYHDDARPDLSRAARQPSAFVGFEDVVATYYYLYVDDHQVGYGGNGIQGSGRFGFGGGRGGATNADRYERRAITQRASVTYR